MSGRPSVAYHWEARFLDRDGYELGELRAESLEGLAAALRQDPGGRCLVVLWLIRSRGNMVEGVIDQDMASLTSTGLPAFFGGSRVKKMPLLKVQEAALHGAAALEAARKATT